MKEKVVKYKLKYNANDLNEIISSDLKKNIFKKRHDLSGEISQDGGFEIWNRATLIKFEPNLGTLVSLNLSCVNSNADGTECNLVLEQKNGLTFYIQYWFSIFFSIIAFGITIYQILTNGTTKIEMVLLPVIGIIYHFIIRLITRSSTQILISRIERMLIREKIKYKKQ